MARPHVHVNVAMTADGKIDTITREGAQISSSADNSRVDRLRADMDAILVGGRTLLDQDPRLTVKTLSLREERREHGLPENPAKVGIISDAEVRSESRFMTSGPARRLIYTTSRTRPAKIDELRNAGAQVFILGVERVDLPAMLESLTGLGIQKLLVEGGGMIIAEFLRLALVDELTIYIAPLIFGGAGAPSLADGAGFSLTQAPRLNLVSVNQFDEEGGILVHYTIHN